MPKAKVKSAGDGDVYEIEIDGKTLRLPRVTSILDTVLSQGKSGMAYWGGQLAIQYMTTMLNEVEWNHGPTPGAGSMDDNFFDEDEWYEDWKSSPMNPIAQRNAAGDRGTAAHDLLEALLKGEAWVAGDGMIHGAVNEVEVIPFVPVRYDLAVVKFYNDYFDKDDNTVVYAEERVYSVEHGYAGTADIIAEDDHGTGIFDLKTHKPPARFSDMLQQSAYGLAWEEMHPGKLVTSHCIVLAQEDGEYVTAFGYVDPEAFLALKRVYDEVVNWQVA